MRLQTAADNNSSLNKALGYTLAAFSMFVVGYTATRAFMAQPQAQNLGAGDSDLVIPHQATLWSDLGN